MKKNDTKTPMIKAKAWNAIQQYFRSYKKYDPKQRKYVEQNPLFDLDAADKIANILPIMVESINEMNNYRKTRKAKKAVHEQREANGYYEKKAAKKAKSKALGNFTVKQTKVA